MKIKKLMDLAKSLHEDYDELSVITTEIASTECAIFSVLSTGEPKNKAININSFKPLIQFVNYLSNDIEKSFSIINYFSNNLKKEENIIISNNINKLNKQIFNKLNTNHLKASGKKLTSFLRYGLRNGRPFCYVEIKDNVKLNLLDKNVNYGIKNLYNRHFDNDEIYLALKEIKFELKKLLKYSYKITDEMKKEYTPYLVLFELS